MTQSPLDNGKKTIALLAGSFSSTYLEGISRGAHEAASRLGYNLIVYAGGPLKSPDTFALSRDTIFELIDTDFIDGVIIPVSSHSRFLDQKETEHFLERYSNIPMVNIGSFIPGKINILTDYSTGMKALFRHLISDHGFRRIAFIRGPENHLTSNLRTEIYKKELESYNIPFDKNLVLNSSLNRFKSRNLVDKLIDDDGNLICDAIVTLNDNQALGIMEGLRDRNFNIPQDIAVCGSNNIVAGLFSEPELTTMNEPKFDLGYEAINALDRVFHGEQGPEKIEIPTSLIIRQTCGCNPGIDDNLNQTKSKISHKNLESSVDRMISRLRNNSLRTLDVYKCSEDKLQLESIIQGFKSALIDQDPHLLYDPLKEKLEQTVKSEDIIAWLSILTDIQNILFDFTASYKKQAVSRNLNRQLTQLRNIVEQKSIKFQNFDTDYYIDHFREIINNLNSSFDINAVRTYAMDILDLKEFHISVYNTDRGMITSATNFISVRNSVKIDIENGSTNFKQTDLIPSQVPIFKERYTLLVFPLSFRKKPLGFLTVDLSKRKGTAYENMQAIISTALKNELQIQDLRSAEERFSDIAHSTSNWLWETDSSNHFSYSSQSAFEVIGYNVEEIIGKDINTFAISDCDIHMQRMKAREKIKNLECWFKHRDGKMVCLIVSAIPSFKNGVFIGYRGVFIDITEQKLQEEKINSLAYSDILTGLPNRAMFQIQLENTINKSRLNNQKFAMMFLDLDRFKYINDSMGHAAGDQLLKIVASILQNALRSNDVVSRLGGDEFTIILPNISHDSQIVMISKRILEKLSHPVTIEDKLIYITVSIGISIYPMDGDTSEVLIKHSDSAMYKAKNQGRNQYVFYDNSIEEKNRKRKNSEDLLHRAIEEKSFTVYYQPQVNVETAKVIGAEALVRAVTADGQVVTPGDFIPLAEDLGLVGVIDLIVFEKVCEQISKWRTEGITPLKISVNLSAIQLKRKKIVDKYRSIAEKFSVETSLIQLEITEYSLIENESIALEILNAFKKEGFSLALDDFGTGYSSLGCIRSYPLDAIKIDRSFVIDSTNSKKSRSVIEAIMFLANSLELSTVVEGVETEEQYRLIKSLNCEKIQGYYFYRPMPIESLNKLLLGRINDEK